MNGPQIWELERSPNLDWALVVYLWNVALACRDLAETVGLLAAVALSACVAPALRAARVDPMTALRCE